MDDLVAFLRARLDEDQLNADAGFSHSDRWVMVGTGIPNGISCTAVLADVAAKRQIIAAFEAAERREKANFANFSAWCSAPDGTTPPSNLPLPDGLPKSYLDGLLHAVRLLALPYADHPDYREGWRP